MDDVTRPVFADAFQSRWIFDVEIIARMRASWPTTSRGPFREAIYEHPLMIWRDVAGSKLKLRDFLTVGIDLLGIGSRYGEAIRQRAADEKKNQP